MALDERFAQGRQRQQAKRDVIGAVGHPLGLLEIRDRVAPSLLQTGEDAAPDALLDRRDRRPGRLPESHRIFEMLARLGHVVGNAGG